MKNQEMRAMSDEELQQNLLELRQSEYSLRVQLATQQHKKTSEKRRIRRMISRIKTIQTERLLLSQSSRASISPSQ